MATEDLNNEIDRFISDTLKTNIFANGDESSEYTADDGEKVPSIRKFLSGLADGVKGYDTLAQLMVVQGVSVGQLAKVTNDPELENNGEYKWNGSTWVKSINVSDQKIEEVNQVVIDNKFPRGWRNVVDGVVDKKTRAAYFYIDRRTGRYVGTPEHIGRNIGEKVLHPVYAEFEYDSTPQRNIVWARTRDGRILQINGKAPTNVELLTVQSPQGRLKVMAASDDGIVTVGSAFNSFNPELTSGRIEYREKATVATYTRYKEFPYSTAPAPVLTITHVIGYGESVAAGTSTDGPVLTTPLMPDQVWMFNAGVLSLGREQDASAKDIVINPAGLQRVEPAKSAIKESPVLAAAYQYAKDNPDKVILVSQHGYGGAVIAGMLRGNESYDNVMYSASMAKAFAESNGAKYEIAPISFIQGTNDWQTPLATYAEMLDTLWSQLNEDLKAVTGQAEDIVLVIDQTLAGGGQNDGALAFAQIEKWKEAPAKFRCSNPRYGIQYDPIGPNGVGDNAHLTAPGSVLTGASQGFAFRATYEPLVPLTAIRSGATVLVEFNESNLVLDTDSVTNPPDGNFGFFWKDDSNSAAIINVTVSDNLVTITLNQEPTGANPQIRIADREDPDAPAKPNPAGKGKRCCLRSQLLGQDSLGNPVYKRAAIYRINVTQ